MKKFTVGNFLDSSLKGGWFIGRFIPTDRLEFDESLEVSVKILPKGWGLNNEHELHFHRVAKEIGIIMNGRVRVLIDGKEVEFKKGDYYILSPSCQEKYLEVLEELELVTIKVPSVENDKILV